MTRHRFEQLVTEAIALIPRRFRREMKNLAVVVEDEPGPELLEEMEIEPPDSLFGLYQGTPLPERTWGFGNALPDKITLFQFPIEEDCEDEDEVRAVIGETLIHEVGHYFGMSEGEIEEIEERYWRGETLGPDVSMLKVNQTELFQRITETMMDISGEYGGGFGPMDGNRELNPTGLFLQSRPSSIYAGSNEIQRNILAKNVLELPG